MENVKTQDFQIIGLSIRTSNLNGQAAQAIGDLWTRFMSENTLSQIPNKIDNTIYSLYTEYEGDHNKPYTVILGCKVNHLDEVPAGLTGKTIAGGNYVKTTAKGNLLEGLIVDQWKMIWDMDLPRVYTSDYEVFGEKAQDMTAAEVDFFIAVE